MDLFLFPALVSTLTGDLTSQVILFRRKIGLTFFGIYSVF